MEPSVCGDRGEGAARAEVRLLGLMALSLTPAGGQRTRGRAWAPRWDRAALASLPDQLLWLHGMKIGWIGKGSWGMGGHGRSA